MATSARAEKSVATDFSDLHTLVLDLCRRVEVLEARQPAPTPDRDGQLVSAIAASYGGSVFSALDLLTASGELHGLVDGMSARTVGAWLKRLRDRPIAGYVLRRVSRDGRGSIWQLAIG